MTTVTIQEQEYNDLLDKVNKIEYKLYLLSSSLLKKDIQYEKMTELWNNQEDDKWDGI